MAKPKLSYKVEKWGDALAVSALDPVGAMEKIRTIEGVTDITHHSTMGVISVRINPLYERDDIAQEIETILSPIPDSFKEAFE